MARRRKRRCPKPPKISLRKVKMRKRPLREIEVPKQRAYTICSSVNKSCRRKAKGRAAIMRPATPQRAGNPTGFTYDSTGAPCSGKRFGKKDRNKCPVQTIWKGGELYLRFCSAQSKKGKLLKLSRDPTKIRRAVTKACAHWKKTMSWRNYAPIRKAKLG